MRYRAGESGLSPSRFRFDFQTAGSATTGRHTPRKRGIQYAAASRFDHGRLGILDRPLSRATTTENVACPHSSHTLPLSRDALSPELCMFLRLEKQRAQGKPGARCTRSRAWYVESTRVSHHRFTGTPGLPCAMVLTAYFTLSPVTGLVCHRHPQEACFLRT